VPIFWCFCFLTLGIAVGRQPAGSLTVEDRAAAPMLALRFMFREIGAVWSAVPLIDHPFFFGIYQGISRAPMDRTQNL
jgi:hypothetical protein